MTILANNIPKYYWDSCIWIELIQRQDSIRFSCCEFVLNEAKSGKCEIWTSAFTLAEVFKRRCSDENAGIAADEDGAFEDLIEQEFIKKVSVDVDVGKVARRLLRRFPKIGKPQDAIHVATCLLQNVDELHTFDREDLLALNGKLEREDRKHLRICLPPYPPSEDQMQMFKYTKVGGADDKRAD